MIALLLSMVGLMTQDVRELRRLNKQEKAKKKEAKAKARASKNRPSVSDSVTLVEEDAYDVTSPHPTPTLTQNPTPNSSRRR